LVSEFLSVLKEFNDQFLKAKGNHHGVTTYEDIFSLTEQIRDYSNRYYNNAATKPFFDKIRDKTQSIVRNRDLTKFAAICCNFIEQVVVYRLSTSTENIKGFDLLHELAVSTEIKKLNIFSLNHDTLVEQFFSKNDMPPVDGFSFETDGDIRYYDPEVYDHDKRISIYKLHGSINWLNIAGRLAISTNVDSDHSRNADGEYVSIPERKPQILTGFNKPLYYNRGIYAELHCRFLQILNATKQIIMSGYGWSDEGINDLLLSWLAKDKENRIIMLYNEKQSSDWKTNMSFRYEQLMERNQLVTTNKWLCETTLEDIRIFLK
jgi:hypothetical protein